MSNEENCRIIENYLTPDLTQIRHSIKGIDDSYNNAWDVYAELLQNSVDAIRQSDVDIGIIKIEVNSLTKTIKVYDNGIGIHKDELPSLLKPFSTNKMNNPLVIGEKGVGLKFVIFSSNMFNIRTGNVSGACEAEIAGAYNWKNSITDDNLQLLIRDINESFIGTEITISDVKNEVIFSLSFKQLKYVLASKTAIGSTLPIWDKDKKIKITIDFTDLNGSVYKEEIPFMFKNIIDFLPDNAKINLDNFKDWVSERDRSDQEKIQKLRDKAIYKIGEFTHANYRKLKYLACFVPKRKTWAEITVLSGLAEEDQLKDDIWLTDYYYCALSNMITISVKGMPTGISIEHPSTGFAGYWSNIFIIFEDPAIKFDIGRKSIHGRAVTIHKEYAKTIFNEFLHYVSKYVSGDLTIEPSEWNRDEIFAQIDNIPNLNSDKILYAKTPVGQEAGVAAVFFECIGRGLIKDIIPMVSGYRNKYDLYAVWNNKKLIIEFKSYLRNIAKDFIDTRKMFDEIDCIVCWEVTDDDKQVLYEMGVTLEEIITTILSTNQRIIPHSTHIMSIASFSKPIYIIDLKKTIR